MKVGTDALLLGSLAQFHHPHSLLDLGTGTGVLALMIAQRYPDLQITALETDPFACEDARHNFAQGAFPECHFELVEADIRHWQSEKKYDAIVSNPPYFGNSFKSSDTSRNTARHSDDTLSFPELIRCVYLHLAENGLFWVILPATEASTLTELCNESGLTKRNTVHLFGKPDHLVRVVMAFSKESGDHVHTQLTVRDHTGKYTPEYIELTRAYHAKDLSQ